MKKVKFGIVGVGDFGVMHIQALKQLPEAEVYAVSCRTESRLKAICEKYKMKDGIYHKSKSVVSDVWIESYHIALWEINSM